jgi:hypothetical protein
MEKIDIDKLAKSLLNQSANIFTDEELEKSIKESILDFKKEYAKPITLIEFIEDNGIKKDVLTSSNISLTIGAAKSKKTFFSTILLAALLGSKDFAINGYRRGLNVILFDTEQSLYHVQKISNRIMDLCGDNLNNLKIIALRKHMPEKRLAMIDYYLKQKNQTYSFVIIDGIVDLLYDFNDLKESKIISTKLMEWSEIYNCHINVVLHTNKDKMNARGHLGSELMNKSETVFKVEKEDDDISKIINEASRNAGFKPFSFRIEKGLPTRIDFPMNYFNNTPNNEKPTILNTFDITYDNDPF